MSSRIPNPLVRDDLEENELKRYVEAKTTELESDYGVRVNGIKNRVTEGFVYAGYNNLRDFYNGNHWSYVKEDGTPMRTYNYCRATVLNYRAFLANEAPEIDIPAIDEGDDIEVARADEVEKVVQRVFEDNNFALVFAEGVFNQSLLGDAFIFGPYVEEVKIDGDKVPRIRFVNIKRVENVRIIWSTEDYEEMDGFIIHYRISRQKAEQIFEDQLEERGIKTLGSGDPVRNNTQGEGNNIQPEMVNVKYYWGDTYMLAMVGSQVVDFTKHDWGFIPGQYIKNITHPTRPWGVSDIEDILDAQVEYNESVASTRGKINQVSIPHVFYAGEGEPMEYESGQAQMIRIGPDDRIFPDPMGQSTAPFDEYSNSRRGDIQSLSQISDIFFGGTNVAKATGRALSVLMTGVNNRVKDKQLRWRKAIQGLVANTLRLVEILEPKAAELIQGDYRSDVFFPAVLLRNITDEINKFNMKLQSLETTQKNIGIPSPRDEQKKMKKEWEDTPLMAEISRNPQLHLQLQQQMQSALAKTLRQTATGPTLSEDQNEKGEEPAATEGVPQQSPVSQRGAVAQEGFRQGEQ